MGARFGRFKVCRGLQMLCRLRQCLPLIQQNTQMEMGFSKIRLQPDRLGKFRFCLLRFQFLRQYSAKIVVQFPSLRLEFDRAAQFRDCPVKVFGEIQRPAQRAMRLRIAGS